jgi:hypothetical protein
MYTWPGVLPAGVTGGKSIDAGPVSRNASPSGWTGVDTFHVLAVLPVIEV